MLKSFMQTFTRLLIMVDDDDIIDDNRWSAVIQIGIHYNR